MQHGAKRSLRDLLFQDAAAILVRFAGMDDERQTGGARGRDMGAKAPRLRFGRAIVVEVIEAGFAERDDLGMVRKRDQFVWRNAVFLVGVVRMGADGAIDVVVAAGDGE